MEVRRDDYKVLVRNAEKKRQLEIHRWEDLKEIKWEGMDRIHLAQDRDQWQIVNT
jgi:hypothetical protein